MTQLQREPGDLNEFTPDLAKAFGVEGDWHFAITRECYWSSVDAFGHANHLSYLEWCQEVRTRYFTMLLRQWPNLAIPGTVVKTLDFTYHRSVGIGDRVLITARTVKLGNTSCIQEYGVWHDGLVGEGKAVNVIVQGEAGSKVRIPDELREAIGKLERSR